MFGFLPPRSRLKLMPQNNVAPAFNPDLAASLRAEMDRCAKCGQCRSICPVFIETGDEAGVARGRISLAEALLDGRIGYSERIQESLTKCLDCLRCDADCPSGVAHELILQAVRQGMATDIGAPRLARFALRHLLPRPRLFETALRLGARIQGLLPATQRPPVRHLPLFLARGARLPRLAPKTARQQFQEMSARKAPSKPSKGRVAIFTGCLINAAYPEVAADLAAVLERIGYEPVLPQGQTCCGAPLLNFGEAAAARRVAEVNRRALAGSGAEIVLTPCAACGHTLKSTYPEAARRRTGPAENSAFWTHWSSSPARNSGRWRRWRKKSRITIRANCAGDRRSRSSRATCCAGAPPTSRCPARSAAAGAAARSACSIRTSPAKIADRKVRSIRESGADVVATACPGCMLLLAQHLPAPPVHVVQILRRAMDSHK